MWQRLLENPSAAGFTRRDLLRGGALAALPAALRGDPRPDPKAPSPLAPDVYGPLGVKPIINARGTYTILSGSLMLPEVRAAMAAASLHYVHLDELAEAIGRRLAELTKAEWGLVTVGCSAALTHASAACVTGGNPDLHVRLPNLAGFPRDTAVIPKHSRNVYDAAVRSVGLRVQEVSTYEELVRALGPRTALIYVLAGPNADDGPLRTAAVAEAAKARGVPLLVDAAAEILTVPNVHLQAGATLVAYSGGKCMRGPQAAGLLLGRKDLVQAAWVSSAPHHGSGRSMKVGKEEAIGMLTAVEMWARRDHEAEWRQWTSWLERISERLRGLDGVSLSVVAPVGLSNRTPSLDVLWPKERYSVDGEGAARHLLETEPRIALHPAEGVKDPAMTGVSVTPYMLAPGEERVVAERIYLLLKNPPRVEKLSSAPPVADLSGQWEVQIEYAAGSSTHTFHVRQRGSDLDGAHQGDFVTRDLSGRVSGDSVTIRSTYTEDHGDALGFSFAGKVEGDEMSGSLDMGEYLKARWKARRHARL